MTAMVTHDGKRWSNADDDAIRIERSDPSWPVSFAAEAAAIDIVLEVPDRDVWPALIQPLERLEYVHWAENPDRTKMFFVKGMPPFGTGRTHHIHVHTPDAIAPIVGFRDYLVAHPEEARRVRSRRGSCPVPRLPPPRALGGLGCREAACSTTRTA